MRGPNSCPLNTPALLVHMNSWQSETGSRDKRLRVHTSASTASGLSEENAGYICTKDMVMAQMNEDEDEHISSKLGPNPLPSEFLSFDRSPEHPARERGKHDDDAARVLSPALTNQVRP